MKISISQQIEEVEYELKQRASVYERIIANHPSRRAELEYHVARMKAVLESLEWARDNRPHVVEWIMAGKPKVEKKPEASAA